MATARIESWPDGPESRAYTADGRLNRPPGWEPPAPENRERFAALIRERVAWHAARERSPGTAATEAHRRGARDGANTSHDGRPAPPYTPVSGIEPRDTASYWNGWENARAARANTTRTTRTRTPR